MAATKPVGRISQVDPGKFVDEENNVWTGSWEAPVYGGAWTGAAVKPENTVAGPNPSPNAPTPTTTPTPAPTPAPTGVSPTPSPTAAAAPTPNPVFQTGGTATKEDQVAEFYRTLLGREASAAEVAAQLQGGSGDLATIQRAIGESEEAKAYSAKRTASAPAGNAQPTAAYLQSLIASGMSPQDAIAKFNKDTGRTTGNEAVYYGPEVHGKATIGLPGEYLSLEGNGWQVTARSPETGTTTKTAPKGPTAPTTTATGGMNVKDPSGKALGTISPTDVTPVDPGVFKDAKGHYYTTDGAGGAIYLGDDAATAIAWVAKNGTASGKAAPTPTPTTTTTGAPGPTAGGNPTGSAGTTGGIYGETDTLAGFREAIMKRLSEINGPVDENAANIREPLSAARNEAQRVTDQERTALAERLYAGGGLNTQAVDQSIQQSAERNAVGLGGLKAQLITREYDARRQDLMQMLAQATSSGDNASARAIQQELAALNAQLTREGYGVDLAKYTAYLNQNAALNGLGG